MPPPVVRELRGLLQHRQRLVWQRSAAKNRLRALLNRHQLAAPAGDLFGPAQRAWWEGLALSPVETLLRRQNLTCVDALTALIQEAEVVLARLSVQPPWNTQVAFLIQLPGISLRNAMTILGAIGDIRRFPSAKALVGYAGLGTRVHDTGGHQRHGGITKQGRRELRTALVEAAWVAVGKPGPWQQQFERLQQRMPRQKAAVAIARKLLVVVWHVLTAQVADRRADELAVARSLLYWGSGQRLATSQGLSRPEFVRQELDRLGLGQELAAFPFGAHVCHLPPSKLGLELPSAIVSELMVVLEHEPA